VTFRSVARSIGRVILVLTVMTFTTIVGIQYARIAERNVALAHYLAQVNHDIEGLKAGREDREREIRRLEDPKGAIPEIHDRLRLVAPGEQIIYLKGQTPAPEAPQ